MPSILVLGNCEREVDAEVEGAHAADSEDWFRSEVKSLTASAT